VSDHGTDDRDRGADSEGSAADPAEGADAGHAAGDPTSADGSMAADSSSGSDAPLADLAGRIADRRRRDADGGGETPAEEPDPDLSNAPPAEDGEDPFEEMSVGEIDEETLWSSLESGETTGVGADVDAESLGGAGPAPGVESVGDDGSGGREHVVPKDTYCQSCPHFGDPPALSCTHEGTDIVEVVDGERFRVRNCPMVDE